DGATVSDNVFLENVAVQTGGAIDVYQGFPSIVNNSIVRNCRQQAGPACVQGGGGIALTNSGVVEIVNNLIYQNEAAVGGGGADLAASSANFRSNDAFGNLPQNY